MTTFARQRNESGCGPVAILNLMKWANPEDSFSYKFWYPHIADMCKTDRKGTDPKDFSTALKLIGPKGNYSVRKMKKLDLDKIYKHLLKGGALILGHFELPQEGVKDPEDHYSLWFLKDEEEIYGVNVLRKPGATVNIWPVGVIAAIQNRTLKNTDNDMEVFLVTARS